MDNPFKIGDKVKCICPQDWGALDGEKVYTVLAVEGRDIKVLDDEGDAFFYPCSDFNDNINRPKHYTEGGIECYDFIESWDMSFPQGNVIKYVTRYKLKGGVEDLKKARWYLDKLIAEAE